MTAPSDVRLVIDRLVLHGVDRADAAAVRRALTSELERMLAGADPDILGAGEVPSLRIAIPSAQSPASLGRESGRALGSRLVGGGNALNARAARGTG